MIMEITKALVLETFMKRYGPGRPDPADKRRALVAYNAALDDLAPFKKNRSEKETEDFKLAYEFLVEILKDDFGIEMRMGRKLSPMEDAGTRDGIKVAEEVLKQQEHRIPPLPEDEKSDADWRKTIRSWAFELAPKDRLSNQEWMNGFLGGFSGQARKQRIAMDSQKS